MDLVVELPKTSTGKVQKYVLRGKEWAGRDKRGSTEFPFVSESVK